MERDVKLQELGVSSKIVPESNPEQDVTTDNSSTDLEQVHQNESPPKSSHRKSKLLGQYNAALELYESGERSGLLTSFADLGSAVTLMAIKKKFDGQLTITQILQLVPGIFSLDGVKLFLAVLELREISGLEPAFSATEIARVKEADLNNDGEIKGAKEVLKLLRKAGIIRFDVSLIIALIRLFFKK